jgi:diguanylate cyclase (GGDEF)-like protein
MSNVGIQLGRVLERERLAAAVRALTLTDELTGLHNRRGFFALASQHLRAVARAKRPTSILFADLDGLKRINDQLGHEAGDEAIARFAKVLRSTFRAADIVSRFGGDEFVILVDGSAAAANTALARLTHQLAEVNQSRSPQAPLAASIGVVEIGADNQDDLETVIARADLAMYENKRTRRATR